MTNKILRSILTVAIIVLLASLAISTSVLYQYFGNMQQAQLRDELYLAANAAESLGERYLAQISSERYRLTWIAADGTVLFDNRAEAASMENHADREEIRQAQLSGSGSSTRRSDTLTVQTIYEAMRLSDGSILRISADRATALVLILEMRKPITLILLIAVFASVFLAKRMARRVVEPLNRLDLENPLENDAYEELTPLLYRIHALHLEIKEQLRILKRSQDEFEQITGNMKEALILLHPTGRILSINPAARTLFGVGMACIGEDFLTIERKQEMRLALEEAKAQGYAAFRSKKNGREYQFDLSRIDSEGNMYGLVILAFDITEQSNAEQNRREFTANVSHELKTPLQSIIGAAELIQNGIVQPEDLPDFIARIHKEASGLVILIEDIIRLSRLDEGAPMPHEAVSLLAICEEVSENLADAAARKGVSLEVSGEAGMIYGVRRLLYELTYNLCENAIKYNKEGGSVRLTVTQRAEAVCLCVADSGIGIAPEHREKVFERFYRVDKSHSKRSGGTGLGLSIVKHAAQYHHARLTLESEPGKGTTITLLFPAKPQ